MKSEIISTSLFITVLVVFIGVFSVVIVGSCNDDNKRAEMVKQTCAAMCTSGVKSCNATSDGKIVVVNCAIDGGHTIRTVEIDGGK